MKKRKIITLFAFLMMFFVLSSCLKKDDFEFENANFEISPTLIVPLFDVDIDLEKMLSLFEETEGYILYGENDEVIVTYSSETEETIEIDDVLKSNKGLRNDTIAIHGSLDIDFFENMENLDANMTDINVQLFASASEEVDVMFRDMRVGAVLRDDSTTGYVELNELFTVSTEDSTEILRENVAQFVNGYPTNFFYEGVLEVDSSFYLGLLSGGQIPETIDFKLYYNCQAKIKGSIHNVDIVNNLDFEIDLEDAVDLEDAILEVNVVNTFPFDFDLEMRLYDENDSLVYDIFKPNYFLESSEVDENGYVIEGTGTVCKKEVVISNEEFHKIMTAKKAVLVSRINSCLEGTKPIVVTKTNGLEINLGIKATPVYSLDF